MRPVNKTFVVVSVIVGLLFLALNWTYSYQQVVRNSGQMPVAEHVDVALPELSPTTLSMGGWPLKHYVAHHSPDLPTVSFFSLSNLLLNITVAVTVMALVLGFEAFALKRQTETSATRRRLSMLDLLAAMTLVASFIVTWRMVESQASRELQLSNQILTRGGQAVETLSLSTPLRTILPAGYRQSLRRITEVSLHNPDDELLKKVLDLPYLSALLIGGGSYDLKQLERLKEKPLLTHLRVSGRKLDASTISTLANLRQLQVLNLMRTNITDRALECLSNLPRLQALDVTHTDVEMKGLANLGFAKTVRVLHLGHPPSGKSCVTTIDSWPELRKLVCNEFDERLNRTPVVLAVRNAPNLKTLELDSLQTFDLEIAQTPMLEQLNSLQTQVKVRLPPDSPPLIGLPVRSLKLENAPKLSSLECTVDFLEEAHWGNDCGADLTIVAPDHQFGFGSQSQNIDSAKLQALINQLAGPTGPTSVTFRQLDLGDVDLSGLLTSQRLVKLRLLNCQVALSRQSGNFLDVDTPLEELDLRGNWITSNEVTRLVKSRTRLRRLYVDAELLGELRLQDAPNLERVFISPDQLHPLQAIHVTNLPAWKDSLNLPHDLVFLTLENVPQLAGLSTRGPWPFMSSFSGVRQLKFFTAGGPNLNDAIFEQVLACKDLQSLTLAYSSITPAMLARIAELTSLKYLTLSGPTIDDALLAQFKSLTELERLNLNDTSISESSLETILGLTRLQHLYLEKVNLSPTALARLGSLTNLVKLSIGGRPLTAEHITALQSLNALRVLDLSESQLDRATLNAIAQLPRLDKLIVRQCQLNEAGFTDMVRQRNLIVDVTNTDVPTPALTHLEQSGRMVIDGSYLSAAAMSNPSIQNAFPNVQAGQFATKVKMQELMGVEAKVWGEVPTCLFTEEFAMQLAQEMQQEQSAMNAQPGFGPGEMNMMPPMTVPEGIGYMLGQVILQWQSSNSQADLEDTIEQ